jgi:hypothetical protein
MLAGIVSHSKTQRPAAPHAAFPVPSWLGGLLQGELNQNLETCYDFQATGSNYFRPRRFVASHVVFFFRGTDRP